MVLVDTSVWIRYINNGAPYAAALQRLLALDQVVGHDLVYGELLIGDRGARKTFLAAYERMHQAPMVPHNEVVELVRYRHLHGRGAGWIDIHLLASAVVGHLLFWTADPRLSVLASEMRVCYTPSA